MSLRATDDWKLTISPVVRLKRLNETFVLCSICLCCVVDGVFPAELRTLCRRVRVSLVSKVNRFSCDKAMVSFTVP